MPPPSIQYAGPLIDLSARIVDTTTVVASPAAAAETVIASLTIPNFGGVAVVQKIYLAGWAAFVVGTSGTAVRFRIRQTDINGTVKADTDALTGGITAGNKLAQDVAGSDATPGVSAYALTMQVTAGAAASTVSAVQLLALVV